MTLAYRLAIGEVVQTRGEARREPVVARRVKSRECRRRGWAGLRDFTRAADY